MPMETIDLVLVFLISLTATFLVVGWHFSTLVIRPRVYSPEYARKHETEAGKMAPEIFDELPREEVWLQSPYGYRLYGLFFPVEGSRKTVILCHGITWNLFGSVKYMDLFYRRGYNVLMYDHRNHGRSGRKNTTYGYYEKHDLKTMVDWVLERVGADSLVGTHGESLGAAVVLQHAAMDPRTAFAIADCPYSDLKRLLAYRLYEQYHLPDVPLLNIASMFSRLRSGMAFEDVSPVRDLAGVTKPILLIHGQRDQYIPPSMSEEMYIQSPETRTLYMAPNAGHAEAFWNNQVEYDRLVGEFLEEKTAVRG